MAFNSLLFLFVFMPVAVATLVLAPTRNTQIKNIVVLLFSLAFYFWGEAWFVLLLLGSSLADFMCGLIISGGVTDRVEQPAEGRARPLRQRGGLILSICVNLMVLSVFKYFNFFCHNLHDLFSTLGIEVLWTEHIDIALPLGISFYTFQSMSYTFDVYYGRVAPTRNPIQFVTFVSLFPQLVAGPIVRYRDLRKDLEHRQVTLSLFSQGVDRFVLGLFKKVLIADSVAVVADHVFSLPANELGMSLAWIGLVAYSLQIYYDFSGYSDMAIGLGLMMGFHFPENFNFPYMAQSLTEFWRRWHITLSSWFRDYVYIPLGGNRCSSGRLYFNLTVVFVLCGLWHGAQWTFVLWGVCHGVFLVVERIFLKSFLESVWRPFRHVYLVLVVMLLWVLFRSQSLPQAGDFYLALTGLSENVNPGWFSVVDVMSLTPDVILMMLLGACGSFPLFLKCHQTFQKKRLYVQAWPVIKLVALAVMYLMSLIWIMGSTHQPFIYFRF